MARGVPHPDETKAAVMAALLTGQGVSEVARQYNLDSGLVSRWKQGLSTEQLQQVAVENSLRIEGLLFGYLEANLTALKAQSQLAGDVAYLKQFPPQQLAVLHGVMADKAVRLIEAASAGQAAEASDPPAEEPDADDVYLHEREE